MPRVLVSACLLGEPVRFDGGHKAAAHPVLARWRAEGCIVPLCPELAGGLPVPRPAAEIVAGRVRTADGRDVTAAFRRGAAAAVALARAQGVRVAVLKQGSPSCGSREVHDGRFAGRRVPGQGLAAAALRAAGVAVFDETEWEAADAALRGALG